jgi:BirA family biotin operon repressor/biotin-[acetyl-CoA-carboxylase] ligase
MTPPREVWHLDTRRLGRRVLVFDRLDSTNRLAATLAEDPANAGLAILADEQTAGRGQYGRSWLAPSGQCVLLSLIVFPPPELYRPVVLTAWAAVAVTGTIQALVGTPAQIKWPNDVLLRDRKVCGILIESALPGAAAQRRPCFIVGIGLNVQQSDASFAAQGLVEATALTQHATQPLVTRTVALHLIRQLDTDFGHLCAGDLAPLEASWREHIGLVDKEVVVECVEAAYQGRLRRLNFDGIELECRGQAPLRLAPERIQHLSHAGGPAGE